MKTREQLNEISGNILKAAYAVYKEFGPGQLESVYQLSMVKELTMRSLEVRSNVRIPLLYKGEPLDKDFIIDLLVEDDVIVELKAVEVILPVHEAQIISYLKLADKRVGILINFNVAVLKYGFKRFVNKF